MKHLTQMTLLAMIACASSASAVAANSTSQASVTLSNLSLSAFDLVPGDSFLPSYEILPGAETFVTTNILGGPPLVKYADGFFTPLSSTASGGVPPLGSDQLPQQSSASIGPNGLTVSATGEGNLYDVKTFAKSHDLTIRLAPGTGILASGTLQMDASAICDAPLICMTSALFSAEFGGSDYGNATRYYRSLYTGWGTGQQQSLSSPAGTTYVNFSDQAQDITLSIYAQATVFTTPVDEPGFAALAIGGLLTTAWLRRRQKAGTPKRAA